MDTTYSRDLRGVSRNLAISFFGDHERGKRLRKAVCTRGWKMTIETSGPADAIGVCCRPDIVILDGFPDSATARSAYYQCQQIQKMPIIALNDSPHAMRFLHVNALSFLRIIDRDPASEALVRTIVDMVASNGKDLPHFAGMKSNEKRTYGYRSPRRCELEAQTCC